MQKSTQISLSASSFISSLFLPGFFRTPLSRLSPFVKHTKKHSDFSKCFFLYQQLVPPRILPDTSIPSLPFCEACKKAPTSL